MLWRGLKLDWKYGLGELFIVTLGVLIALAIDQWNEVRLERADERHIVDQMVGEVEVDIQNVSYAIEGLGRKEASLERLKQVLIAGLAGADKRQFLEDIVIGANFGWNQGHAQSTSFDEVVGSGRFSLVRDSALRMKISTYYKDWLEYGYRADERETGFPRLSYTLVPRKFVSDFLSSTTPRGSGDGVTTAGGQVGILLFDPDTPVDEIDTLADKAFATDLAGLVIAELNFARFVQGMMADIKRDAIELKSVLEDYRSSLL